LKAIVGGRLEASLDAEPIEFSVVVIAEGKIRAAGPQASTPVPKGAETISAKGLVIQPMPYTGKIAPGEPADLMLRNAESFAPDRLMRDGEWVQ
jgi:imidazolonepropionase-like amidohydrolase